MPTRPPITVLLFMATSWILASWLLVDALHQRLFGDYFRIEGQLGPWADLAQAVGLNPSDLSWTFILLGSALFSASFGLHWRARWGQYLGLGASALLLLYLGFGTPFALVCLILLFLKPTQTYLAV